MSPPLVLPPELTIYTASAVHAQCLEWLHGLPACAADDDATANGVVVEAGRVSEVDAAGVQLLMALSNSLDGVKRTLRLQSPSRELTDACCALGAQRLMANATSGGESNPLGEKHGVAQGMSAGEQP